MPTRRPGTDAPTCWITTVPTAYTGPARRKMTKDLMSTASPSLKKSSTVPNKRSPSGKVRSSEAMGLTSLTSSAIIAVVTATTPPGVPLNLTTELTRTKKRSALILKRKKIVRNHPKPAKRRQSHMPYSPITRPHPIRQTAMKTAGTPCRHVRGCPGYSTSKYR